MVEKSDLAPSPLNWWQHFYEPVRLFGERVADIFTPNSDASSTDDSYEINIELPGVEEKDISVEVRDETLVITGEKRAVREESGKDFYFSERSYGGFRRAFRLPIDADGNAVTATFKNGVLTIAIAKKTGESPNTRKVEVSAGQGVA